MRKYIKTALVLALICAVAAVLLAVVNSVTEPYIAKYESEKVTKALEEVSSGFDIGEETAVENEYVTSMYTLLSNGKVVGYILELATRGYAGDISLLAGYDLNGAVSSVKIVSDSETPGVGKKAHNDGYMDKFIGKGASNDNPIPTTKGMLSEADSLVVSGATMTFTGISSALKAGAEYVKSLKEVSR